MNIPSDTPVRDQKEGTHVAGEIFETGAVGGLTWCRMDPFQFQPNVNRQLLKPCWLMICSEVILSKYIQYLNLGDDHNFAGNFVLNQAVVK